MILTWQYLIGTILFMLMASAVTAATMHHHYSVHRQQVRTEDNKPYLFIGMHPDLRSDLLAEVSPAIGKEEQSSEEYGEEPGNKAGDGTELLVRHPGSTPGQSPQPAVYQELTPEALQDAWVNEYGE